MSVLNMHVHTINYSTVNNPLHCLLVIELWKNHILVWILFWNLWQAFVKNIWRMALAGMQNLQQYWTATHKIFNLPFGQQYCLQRGIVVNCSQMLMFAPEDMFSVPFIAEVAISEGHCPLLKTCIYLHRTFHGIWLLIMWRMW